MIDLELISYQKCEYQFLDLDDYLSLISIQK